MFVSALNVPHEHIDGPSQDFLPDRSRMSPRCISPLKPFNQGEGFGRDFPQSLLGGLSDR